MSLETFTGKVSDLVPANPAGTDPKSQGDDHLRGIKETIIGQSVNCQIGQSVTPANNFTLTAANDNGTMKLARGNVGETTQDIMTVAADGKVAFPATPATPAPGDPAFSAYANAQSATGDLTLSTFTETFVTNACFDPTTGKFTPNVAGYYSFNAAIQVGVAIAFRTFITKNGVAIWYGQAGGDTMLATTAEALIFCNGTTDFVQMGVATVAGWTLATGDGITYFQGFMARKA